MNTKQMAINSILSFLKSRNKFLLLTGTHQTEKHPLVLSLVFSKYPPPATVLFRTNHSRNVKDFLLPIVRLPREPKRGVPINIGSGFKLFTDTFNPVTWRSLNTNIDIAILYPIDSLDYDNGDSCVHNILIKKPKKIFLVSWTDTEDYGWTDQFNPVHVIYDAEEDNQEYHERVKDHISSSSLPKTITKKLPRYAQSIDDRFLIQILCRTCSKTRWAKLNKPYPGKTAIKQAIMDTYRATCLICGYLASDNYNWFR